MDWLAFLEPEELLRYFRCNKTVMSSMENPHTFLRQLRDHDLILEDTYRKVSRMKKKENLRKALYDVLDWVERERSQSIKQFWRCAFEDNILNDFPALRLLRQRLMDGSFKKAETDKRKRKELKFSEVEEEEEEQGSSGKKKRKLLRTRMCEDDKEQQPGPSSQPTPRQRKKTEKVCFSSPIKKGEKKDIWTWPFYKTQLPVTCGSQKGRLSRKHLEKGEKCIMFQKQWFTPGAFEKFAGKGSNKNWKFSIKCMGCPLGKLIKDGHLKSAGYKKSNKTDSRQAKRSLFSSDGADVSVADEERATENQTEPEVGKVFKVTCFLSV